MTPFTFQGYGKEGSPITLGEKPEKIAVGVVARENKAKKLCAVTPIKSNKWETAKWTVVGKVGTIQLGEFREGVIFGIDETPIELSLKKNTNSAEVPIGTISWEEEQKVTS